MGKKAFEKIARGLNEAVEFARGDLKPVRLYVPAELNVKAIRTKLELSQDDFSAAFGFTVNQIRDWEQQRSRPLGGVRAYLMMIDSDPDAVRDILHSAKSKRAA
jgi:putative transcriptional regulator